MGTGRCSVTAKALYVGSGQALAGRCELTGRAHAALRWVTSDYLQSSVKHNICKFMKSSWKIIILLLLLLFLVETLHS